MGFHFDIDVVEQNLRFIKEKDVLFSRGLDDLDINMSYDLSDNVMLASLVNEEKGDTEKQTKYIFQQTLKLLDLFSDAADKLIIEVFKDRKIGKFKEVKD